MTILEAYNITKSFQTYFGKEKPFLSSEIMLIKIKNFNRLIHYYWFVGQNGNRIKKTMSKKTYDSYIVKEIENTSSNKSLKKIDESLFLTSVGLVSEEDFYKAEDIMENTKFLKRRDLEIDSVYLDIKGREFLYIGDLIINPENRKEKIYKSQLLNLENKMFIYFSSLKLVKFSHKYKKEVSLDNITMFKSESKRLI